MISAKIVNKSTVAQDKNIIITTTGGFFTQLAVH
jgi:hypothetical protein